MATLTSASAYETLCEIAATASILIKFGHCDILENNRLFVAFLNELGINFEGKKITTERMHEMTQEITHKQKKALIEEFNIGHEPIYRKLAMHGA